jgi:uncharacterized membrane protein YadS
VAAVAAAAMQLQEYQEQVAVVVAIVIITPTVNLAVTALLLYVGPKQTEIEQLHKES